MPVPYIQVPTDTATEPEANRPNALTTRNSTVLTLNCDASTAVMDLMHMTVRLLTKCLLELGRESHFSSPEECSDELCHHVLRVKLCNLQACLPSFMVQRLQVLPEAPRFIVPFAFGQRRCIHQDVRPSGSCWSTRSSYSSRCRGSPSEHDARC